MRGEGRDVFPRGGEALAAVPALTSFDFPVALVVTDGASTLLEAGDVLGVLPFASVTKLIVAWSALVAVDRGLTSLDAPAGPPGATVRHLLSHASGVAFDSDTVLAPPGTRRIYSNRGFEILGAHLQDVTATPLEQWVEVTVLEPLGMASVMVPASPAWSGTGSAADLALLARELAAPTLVSAVLAHQARRPVWPRLDGVLPGYGRQSPNEFGLGAEVRGHKSPHWTGRRSSPETFGHFGQAGSFLWVDPVAGRQAVFLGERPFGRVHREVWPVLNDQVLALGAR